jgi:hypothetical protein
MKQQIKIAANRTVINHIEKEIDFPETSKYYSKIDDSRFFGRGTILFAIIPRAKNRFLLIQVESSKQDYNDFVPSDDCQKEYWLQSTGSIRHQALNIMSNPKYGFTEMTEKDFEEARIELLNNYKS